MKRLLFVILTLFCGVTYSQISSPINSPVSSPVQSVFQGLDTTIISVPEQVSIQSLALTESGGIYDLTYNFYDINGNLENNLPPSADHISVLVDSLVTGDTLISSMVGFYSPSGYSAGNHVWRWYSADDMQGTAEAFEVFSEGTNDTLITNDTHDEKYFRVVGVPVQSGGYNTQGDTLYSQWIGPFEDIDAPFDPYADHEWTSAFRPSGIVTDGSGVDNGENITSWINTTGGNNLVQNSSDQPPRYSASRDAAEFLLSGSELNITTTSLTSGNSGGHLFMRAQKKTNAASYGYFFALGGFTIQQRANGDIYIDGQNTGYTMPNDEWTLLEVYNNRNGSGSFLRVNGDTEYSFTSSTSSTGTNGKIGSNLGGSGNFLDAYISHLLLDVGQLADTRADSVVTWFENNAAFGSGPDVTAPTFSVAPATANVTDTDLDVTATMDEDGTVYVKVLSDGASAPTVANIIATPNFTGVDSGSGVSISVTGLTASTAYDIYVAAEDEAGNNIASAVKLDVTTAAPDETAPVPSFNPANSATDIGVAGNLIITFDEGVRNIDGSEITDLNVDDLITLKEDNASGADFTFDATISLNKEQITINPTGDLATGQDYYYAVSPVEDDNGNEMSGSASATFTTTDPAASTLTKVAYNTVNSNPKGFVEYLPANYDPEGSYPLLVWFHGLGEEGYGTDSDLNTILNTQISNWLKTNDVPFIIAAPQHWSAYWDHPHLENFVQHMINNYPVDENQVHVAGLSAGGYGIRSWIQQNTALFQSMASLTIMGSNLTAAGFNNTNRQAVLDADISVWLFTAQNDPSPNNPQQFYDSYEYWHANDVSGNTVEKYRMTNFASSSGIGHNEWNYVYNNAGRNQNQVGGSTPAPNAAPYYVWGPSDETWYSWMISQSKTIDVTAPILSSASASATGHDTGSINFSTDEASGQAFVSVTTSSTEPNTTQIRAGQDHTGAGAVYSGTIDISSTGAQVMNFTGLTQSTTYYAYVVQADASNNESNIVSDNFTTDSDGTPPSPTFSPLNGATGVLATVIPTISFDEDIYNTDGSGINNTNVDALIELKETNDSGSPVSFDATISGNTITVTPDANLSYEQLYYLEVASVEDADGNETTQSSVTWTTEEEVVEESRILINLAYSSTVSNPDSNGNYWNNITSNSTNDNANTASYTVSDLIGTSNTATTVDFVVVDGMSEGYGDGSGANLQGGTASTVGEWVSPAGHDSWFSESGDADGGGQWQLTGLDASKTYTIIFWGSRAASGNRYIEIATNSGYTSSQNYNGANNTTASQNAEFVISGVTTQSFYLRSLAGSQFGYVSVIDITWE